MTMTATVNSDCSVDYTAYISDIYDFDHNSWLQTRFAALEKYGYAAPFNVRGNISGTYRTVSYTHLTLPTNSRV